jgi:hypothetical protein
MQPHFESSGPTPSYSGEAPSKAPGPGDLSSTPEEGPSQPTLRVYPVKEQTGRRRSFRSVWYMTYQWLEYSPTTDAAFCYACRHFPSNSKDSEPAFISTGYNNWKKAQTQESGFPKHSRSDSHAHSMIMWTEFKLLKSNNLGSVLQMQNEVYAKQVNENRHYVKTVAEVLLLTASQNIAQRGHRETNAAVGENPGNFKKILKLVTKNDKTISERFCDGSLASRYTSKDIQNEILATLGDMVRDQIMEEIKQAGYFSILVDETKDISRKEQLSFVLRFFANNKINECFIDFKPAEGLDAKSLASLILNTLQTQGLDIETYLVGQGYDGASVMSGINKGVQQIVRQSAPLALYIHCYAHRLNLVLVDACQCIREANDFFALLEKLYVFTSSSVMHKKWVDVQTKLYPGEPVRQLQRLSDTRWACRVTACRNIRDRLDALICVLDSVAVEGSGDRSVEANGLLCMINFKFILSLHLFSDILGKIHVVSAQLQSSCVDLSAAADLVQNLTAVFKDMRDTDAFSTIFSMAEEHCKECNIDPVLPIPRVRKLPRRLQSAIIENSLGHCTVVDSQTSFRQHIYYPVVDCLISELERRFSNQSVSVMHGIQALTPRHASFLSSDKIHDFAALYQGNAEDLSHEIYQLKRMLQRDQFSALNMKTLVDLACVIEPYKLAFQELYRLITIAIVLPVTSASCERSFSALKLIKSYLRSTMSDSRLSSIAILSIESARAESLNLDLFVDEFDARHDNRKLALH